MLFIFESSDQKEKKKAVGGNLLRKKTHKNKKMYLQWTFLSNMRA